jgi:hypothetical protein
MSSGRYYLLLILLSIGRKRLENIKILWYNISIMGEFAKKYAGSPIFLWLSCGKPRNFIKNFIDLHKK